MAFHKLNGVAKTSLLTAAMRAIETKVPPDQGRLFSDPYAEKLAGAEGMEFARKAIEIVGDQPAIAVRTAFIDEKFLKAINEGVQQIVIIAAGMDSRIFRLKIPSTIHLFELDQIEIFKYKNEKLNSVESSSPYHQVACNLVEDWVFDLIKTGFQSHLKTLWLVEGLLMYLKEDQVFKLFNRINSLAKQNDVLLLDILTRALLDLPFMEKQLKFLSDMGAPWNFGLTEEPEQFFEKLGWSATATMPAEFCPARWPFPAPPRSIPNMPRSFFIEAIKL